MKTTKTVVKRLSASTRGGEQYVAEIRTDDTDEVLIVGVGSTEDAARADARKNWRETIERFSN